MLRAGLDTGSRSATLQPYRPEASTANRASISAAATVNLHSRACYDTQQPTVMDCDP